MKKILYFAAMAALLLVSCNQDEPKINEPEKKTDAFTFKASIEDLATSGNAGSSSNVAKATINGSYGLNWATGDKIGIYVNEPSWNDKNQPFTLSSGAGTTEGEFAWDETGEFSSNAAVAFFPWEGKGDDKNHVHEGTMNFRLRDSYYSYESGKMLTPLVAPLTGSTDEIHFKHAGAAVKVTINNLPAHAHSIGMSVYGQQITGNYSINPANAGTDALALVGDANTSQNTIWLNYTNASESEWTFIFPVPELTNPKLSFEIYDKNDVKVWSKSLKAQANNLGRADLLVMPAIDIEPYGKFTVSSEWTFCGTINGSAWRDDVPMYTDGNVCILSGFTFRDGDHFKIRKNKSYDVSYPASDWSFNSGNAGAKDILFYPNEPDDNKKIKVVDHECPYPSSDLVTLYFGINSTIANSIHLSSYTLEGGAPWPGTELTEREFINGKWFYKYVVNGGTIWGNSEVSAVIVCKDNWTTNTTNLNFSTIKAEYYFEATKDVDISQLASRPTDPEHKAITIGTDMSDWTSVTTSVTSGNNQTAKFESDATNIYVYYKRTKAGDSDTRYDEIWGGGGYVYVAFDLDNDPSTGSSVIWDSHKFEFYTLLYPFAGSSSSPAFYTSAAIASAAGKSWSSSPSGHVSNISLFGVATSGTAEIELSIPRSDIPDIPKSGPITIKLLGNKDLGEFGMTFKM